MFYSTCIPFPCRINPFKIFTFALCQSSLPPTRIKKTKLINAKEIRKANGHLQGVQPANLWTFNQLDTNQKLDVYKSAFPISNCCPGNLLCKIDCSRDRWMASLDASNLIQIIKNRRIKYNHVSSWVLLLTNKGHVAITICKSMIVDEDATWLKFGNVDHALTGCGHHNQGLYRISLTCSFHTSALRKCTLAVQPHPRFLLLETALIFGHVTVMVMHQRIYSSQVTSLHFQTEEDHQDTASFLPTRDSKNAMSDLAHIRTGNKTNLCRMV